ncbi:MAG: S8 family serine peptidase [candidate division Zixibacteria bacterium]|nr:S8 family serine peptidase [candidate division Zixibacteria bacterium]
MLNGRGLLALTLALAGLLLAGGANAQDKIKIEKLDELPRHTYQAQSAALNYLHDTELLLGLAAELKTDLESDLAKYDIADKTTLKEYYNALGVIALLQERYDDYLKYNDLIIDLEDKDAAKMTSGLLGRAWCKARQSEGDLESNLAEEYARQLTELPYETVGATLKANKGRYEMINENLISGMIESRTQTILDKTNGEMSKDIAMGLLSMGFMVHTYLPVKQGIIDVLAAYLEANEVDKKDIWAARDVTLTDQDKGNEVIVCVWDSGSDVDVFKDVLWTNPKEIPGNNKDDDNNGWVDDVHGIALTLHSDKTTEMLFPIEDVESERPMLQKLMKGLSDLQANIESDESAELKTMMGSLKQEEAQPFIENISKYGNYAHGTHVAGIAMRGNPFARLLISRLTFGYTMIPECPTVEMARKDSAVTWEVVDYYRKNGVRVVNMSWGGDLAGVEAALEANNAGGTPEERKALARQIFEINKMGLYKAMESAPEILWITSAGNDDNNVEFDEVIPSSFDFPNIMTVGAVDQAGDETSFTSFGKTDVYANGFEVLSYVPGGDKLTMSGTSQASPNVTNLAAKILALHPELTPVQVKDLIVKGADEKKAGDRTVRLMNPKNTMALLQQM